MVMVHQHWYSTREFSSFAFIHFWMMMILPTLVPGTVTMRVCMWPTTWRCYYGSIHVTNYLEMLLWEYIRDWLPADVAMGVCTWQTTWGCYYGSLHVTDYLEMLLWEYMCDWLTGDVTRGVYAWFITWRCYYGSIHATYYPKMLLCMWLPGDVAMCVNDYLAMLLCVWLTTWWCCYACDWLPGDVAMHVTDWMWHCTGDWEIDYVTGGPFIVHVTDSSDIQVYGMKDGTVCTNPELIGRSWFCHVFCQHNPELIGRSWFCYL